jgi:hypothetical protein
MQQRYGVDTTDLFDRLTRRLRSSVDGDGLKSALNRAK